MLLALWILTIFFWKISGSHFNPAVTLALMFRRDERKMPITLGLAYIVAQVIGGTLGALLANFFTFNLPQLETQSWIVAILQEILCSFMFVFFFQITTDENMLFSNEKAINCFIISSSYVGSRAIFVGNKFSGTMNYGAIANPAVALGIQFSGFFNYGFETLTDIWIYPVLPFAGSVASVFFYEIIYKKTRAVIEGNYNGNVSVDSDSEKGEHD